jgi:hypothetical protein
MSNRRFDWDSGLQRAGHTRSYPTLLRIGLLDVVSAVNATIVRPVKLAAASVRCRIVVAGSYERPRTRLVRGSTCTQRAAHDDGGPRRRRRATKRAPAAPVRLPARRWPRIWDHRCHRWLSRVRTDAITPHFLGRTGSDQPVCSQEGVFPRYGFRRRARPGGDQAMGVR